MQAKLGWAMNPSLDSLISLKFSLLKVSSVTIFTLVWTLSNVIAHIAIGLFLAILLNDQRLRGRVGYRTIMLLPWAIPSYISVLIWRGIFQPDGLLNDLLGTDLNLFSPTLQAHKSLLFWSIFGLVFRL